MGIGNDWDGSKRKKHKIWTSTPAVNIPGIPCHGSASKLQLVLCCVASPSTNVAVRTKVAIFTSFLLQHLNPGILVVKAMSWPNRWVEILRKYIGKCLYLILIFLDSISSRCVPRFAEKKYMSFKIPGASNNAGSLSSHFITSLVPVWLLEHPPDSIQIFRARGRIYMQGRSLNGSSEWYPIFNKPQVGVCGFTMVCYGFLTFFVGWSSPNPGKTIENGFSWIKYDQRPSNIIKQKGQWSSFAKQQLLFNGYIYGPCLPWLPYS